MRFVALLSPGPAAIEGLPLPAHDSAIISAHLAAMRRLYEAGSLLFGGPYAHGLAGVALLEAEDEQSAAVMLDADPAIAAGIIAFKLEAMRPAFDAFAGVAGPPSKRP